MSEYAYLLKDGGLIYNVTDVKDLYEWNLSVMRENAQFEEVTSQYKVLNEVGHRPICRCNVQQYRRVGECCN